MVEYAWDKGGFTTKSNYAQTYANEVAEAALRGLITTQVTNGAFSNVWRPPPVGLSVLWTERISR